MVFQLILAQVVSASIAMAATINTSESYFLDSSNLQDGTGTEGKGYSYSNLDDLMVDTTGFLKSACESKPAIIREQVWWSGLTSKRKCKNIDYFKTTYSWVGGSCKGTESLYKRSTSVECRSN